MQLIAETYDRAAPRRSACRRRELADIFDEWNHGPLESFLIEITATVCRMKDAETGQPLVDMVLDKAGQKGTGKWTVQVGTGPRRRRCRRIARRTRCAACSRV